MLRSNRYLYSGYVPAMRSRLLQLLALEFDFVLCRPYFLFVFSFSQLSSHDVNLFLWSRYTTLPSRADHTRRVNTTHPRDLMPIQQAERGSPNRKKNKSCYSTYTTKRVFPETYILLYLDAKSASPLALAEATKGVGTVARKLKM